MTLKSLNTKIKAIGLKSVCIACVAGALAACAATKGSDSNPIFRKFQWFSYIEGEDFRDTCDATSDRYRLIYNAVYTEQVRIYEVSTASQALHARVMSTMDLRDFNVDSLSGLLDPWRGRAKDAKITKTDLAGLVSDLEGAGVFDRPNVGEELSSRGFFWTIAACHNGTYHFTGFAWPSEKWDKLRFSERLFSLDVTGVAINEPRKTKTGRPLTQTNKSALAIGQEYHLKVGENGLWDLGSMF